MPSETQNATIKWHPYYLKTVENGEVIEVCNYPAEYGDYLVTINEDDPEIKIDSFCPPDEGDDAIFPWNTYPGWAEYDDRVIAWAELPDPYSTSSYVDDDTTSTDYADIY